jgi:hypothetical protein
LTSLRYRIRLIGDWELQVFDLDGRTWARTYCESKPRGSRFWSRTAPASQGDIVGLAQQLRARIEAQPLEDALLFFAPEWDHWGASVPLPLSSFVPHGGLARAVAAAPITGIGGP